MLVLARQLNERIVLPTVGATIEVVALKPGSVRLGIEAPPEVTILREEVYRRGPAAGPGASGAADAAGRLARVKHALRPNRLHTVALGLALLRRQLHAQPVPGADAVLGRLEDEIRSLDRQLEAALGEPPAEAPGPVAGRPPAPCLEGSGDSFAI
jgi:carbon storage regulator CsrA